MSWRDRGSVREGEVYHKRGEREDYKERERVRERGLPGERRERERERSMRREDRERESERGI